MQPEQHNTHYRNTDKDIWQHREKSFWISVGLATKQRKRSAWAMCHQSNCTSEACLLINTFHQINM